MRILDLSQPSRPYASLKDRESEAPLTAQWDGREVQDANRSDPQGINHSDAPYRPDPPLCAQSLPCQRPRPGSQRHHPVDWECQFFTAPTVLPWQQGLVTDRSAARWDQWDQRDACEGDHVHAAGDHIAEGKVRTGRITDEERGHGR